MRIPVELTITYFKPSGKFYAEAKVVWDVQVIPIPKACTHTVYMSDAVDQLLARRDDVDGHLPGLATSGWEGPILLTCTNGVSCLVMPGAPLRTNVGHTSAESRRRTPPIRNVPRNPFVAAPEPGPVVADTKDRALLLFTDAPVPGSVATNLEARGDFDVFCQEPTSKRAEYARAEKEGRLPRGPSGWIDNCLLAYSGRESGEHGPCQMCKGTCPDRDRLNHADGEPSKPAVDKPE